MLEHVKQGSVLMCHIHAGHVHENFHEATHKFRDLDDGNLKLLNSFISAGGPFHEDNRNRVIEKARTRPRIEYLLFVDTDIDFKPEMPYQLLHMANDSDRRIVAGLYFGKPGWSDEWLPQWYSLNEKKEFTIVDRLDGNPLQRIDGAGGGCLLVHMSVFDEFPETEHNWRWFGRDPWTVDGKIEHLGEDLTFFLRLNRLCYPGFERWTNMPSTKIPIWGHRGVVVDHYKETVIGLKEYLAQKSVTSIKSPEEQVTNYNSPRIIIPN